MQQSRDAAYHPGVTDVAHSRNIRVNGDGFGVAWYADDTDCAKGSCLFRFVTPAWSNENLRNICDHVQSPVFFAHVRAASTGLHQHEYAKTHISSENCHPFKFGRYTFVHNGDVAHFPRIKRALINMFPDEVYASISGSTDSEHLFALFLTLLPELEAPVSLREFADTVSLTISTLVELLEAADIYEASSLNLVISDGMNVVATRYRTGASQPPSLYYNYGSGFQCNGSSLGCADGRTACEIVIASAPLSWIGEACGHIDDVLQPGHDERGAESLNYQDRYGTWVLVPKDYMLVCQGDPASLGRVLSLTVEPVEPSLAGRTYMRSVRSNSCKELQPRPLVDCVVAQLVEACCSPRPASPRPGSRMSLRLQPRDVAPVHCARWTGRLDLHLGSFLGGMLALAAALLLAKALA